MYPRNPVIQDNEETRSDGAVESLDQQLAAYAQQYWYGSGRADCKRRHSGISNQFLTPDN